MNDDPTLVAPTSPDEAPRRKPWQPPVIEDVSVALTSKNNSTYETGTTKDGS